MGPGKNPSTKHRGYFIIHRSVRYHHTKHVANMVYRPYREGRDWRYWDVYGQCCCGRFIRTLEETGEEDVARKINFEGGQELDVIVFKS